jgi:isopentenyl diphosphate isomerase/L-lactate dehydrogenase-like FMN-dependent dehydrogenase
LRFLAGSPLLAYLDLPAFSTALLGEPEEQGPEGLSEDLIASPGDAISVFDFEPVARKNLPPAHYGYLATGVDADVTLRANREGFSKFQIRPRRLVNVSKIDMSTELFGVKWETPIVLAPAGSQGTFHPDGELATARAAKSRRHLQILSTVTSTSVEEVTAARGAPVWYQLYPTSSWNVTQALLQRAQSAGCPLVVLTVDLPLGGNRETLRRFIKKDTRDCSLCHSQEGGPVSIQSKPMFEGLDLTGADDITVAGMTWGFTRRLRNTTRMKLVLKGIVTREDARLCLEHEVDGIIVSNHGGRAEESGRSTIECLPEVLEAVAGRIPVLIDSGFRRGTDLLKALALGARAICIGRPYLWGLAAFGQAGVETVLDILRGELELAMQTAGAPSIDSLSPAFIQRS